MSLYTLILFIICIFFSTICSIQDIKENSVNNIFLVLANLSALLCHFIFNLKNTWIFLLSAFISGSFYFLIQKISKNKLGFADIIFGIFQGFFIPFSKFYICIFIELFSTLLFFLILGKKKKLPFIPFMSFSVIVNFFLIKYL